MSFDYRSHAEAALNAQSAYKHYLDDAYQKLHIERNRKALDELQALRNSSEFHRVWEQYILAVDAAYPPDYDEDFEKLRSRTDLKALDTAVSFLEADPFFFRTGYMKEKLLRYVRGYQLTSDYVIRLQNVLLQVVDDHYCREFREYCKLARKIDNDELRLALQSRLDHSDPNIRKRGSWMLDYLKTL